MSSPTFFRSARFLDSDDFDRSLLNFILIAALIVAWLVWFFFAQITIYEATDNAYFESRTQLMAEFSPEALVRVQASQSAQLRLDDFPFLEYGTVSAIVTRVGYKDGRVQVRLRISPDTNSDIRFKKGMTGSVVIPVEKVSPATLVLYTAAERFGRPNDGNQ